MINYENRMDIETCMQYVRTNYDLYGIDSLYCTWFEKNGHNKLYKRLCYLKKTLEDISKELNVYDEWKEKMNLKLKTRSIIANTSQKCVFWTDESIKNSITKLVLDYGYVPSKDFLEENGYKGLSNAMRRFGGINKYIEDNNIKCSKNLHLFSIDKQKWRSMAECCLANHLIDRKIKFEKGRSYGNDFKVFSGKNGVYDLHFIGTMGIYKDIEINVEIWGGGEKNTESINDNKNKENNKDGKDTRTTKYNNTRKNKEKFINNDEYFLGIEYKDCYNTNRLIDILSKYLGSYTLIDKNIDIAKWSVSQEVFKITDEIYNNLNFFPYTSWFRCVERIKLEWEPKLWHSYLHMVQIIGGINIVIDYLNNKYNINVKRSLNELTSDDVVNEIKDIHYKHNKSISSLHTILHNKSDLTDIEKDLKSQIDNIIYLSKKYFGSLRNAYAKTDIKTNNYKVIESKEKFIEDLQLFIFNNNGKSPASIKKIIYKQKTKNDNQDLMKTCVHFINNSKRLFGSYNAALILAQELPEKI